MVCEYIYIYILLYIYNYIYIIIYLYNYIYSLRMCEKIRWPWSLPRQPWCWPHWLAWHPLAPNSFGRMVIWTWEGRNPQWCQSKSRLKVHKITLYPGPFLWAQDAWGVWELTWGMQLFALPQPLLGAFNWSETVATAMSIGCLCTLPTPRRRYLFSWTDHLPPARFPDWNVFKVFPD